MATTAISPRLSLGSLSRIEPIEASGLNFDSYKNAMKLFQKDTSALILGLLGPYAHMPDYGRLVEIIADLVDCRTESKNVLKGVPAEKRTAKVQERYPEHIRKYNEFVDLIHGLLRSGSVVSAEDRGSFSGIFSKNSISGARSCISEDSKESSKSSSRRAPPPPITEYRILDSAQSDINKLRHAQSEAFEAFTDEISAAGIRSENMDNIAGKPRNGVAIRDRQVYIQRGGGYMVLQHRYLGTKVAIDGEALRIFYCILPANPSAGRLESVVYILGISDDHAGNNYQKMADKMKSFQEERK